MDSRSEASERFLNERREYWRRIKREEEKYSKEFSPRKATGPHKKKQECLSNGLSSAPVRGTISDSKASERFLNERRQYWRQIAKEEGRAPRLDVKREKANTENTEDPNSLSAWQIILIIIVGGLFGWLMAEAGSLILLFALFIGALFLKCLR